MKHQFFYGIILSDFLRGFEFEVYLEYKKAREQLRYLERSNVNGKFDIDIDILKSLINDEITPFAQTLSLKEKLEFDKEKINEYSYFLKPIEDFYNITKKCRSGYLYEIDLSISDLLTFVNDFF